MAKHPNYQVSIPPIDRERIFQTGVCIGWDHRKPGICLFGKRSLLRKAIKELGVQPYTKIEPVQN